MDESESRSAIKAVAEELLVRHGYRGMVYAEIADRNPAWLAQFDREPMVEKVS